MIRVKMKYKILLVMVACVCTLNAGEVYATFNVIAKQSAVLAFDASGIVNLVSKDIADVVKKGELLASLDNKDKSANLASAKSTLKYAKKAYERQLKVKNLINEEKFDSYALRYEQAKSQLAYQEALYKKTLLVAPFSGVIFYKDIDIGDTLSAVRLKSVYKIQSFTARKLILEFDQKYNKSVKVGDKYKYKIDGDNKEYTGTIIKVYPFANTNNRKVQAEVAADNILVGLFGAGIIMTQE